MLPESKNIQVLADNVRILDARTQALDIEIPEHTTSDAGKVLTVDSEGDLEWALTIPEYSDSDEGKILAVDSNGDLEWKEEYSYTPPAYSSTEEVNTGQKWIDGKDIFMKRFSGTLPVVSSVSNVTIIENFIVSNLVKSELHIERSEQSDYYTSSTIGYTKSGVGIGAFFIVSCPTSYSELPWSIVIYYTKPDPEPEPGPEENLTKKKGAKK